MQISDNTITIYYYEFINELYSQPSLQQIIKIECTEL